MAMRLGFNPIPCIAFPVSVIADEDCTTRAIGEMEQLVCYQGSSYYVKGKQAVGVRVCRTWAQDRAVIGPEGSGTRARSFRFQGISLQGTCSLWNYTSTDIHSIHQPCFLLFMFYFILP